MSDSSFPLSVIESERFQSRFWGKVSLPNAQGCMEWLAARDPNGYGRFGVWGKRTRLAHHVSIWLAVREDPAGRVVRHSCDNPPCVNPLHLSVGTHQDNVADKVSKLRHAWRTRTGENNNRTKLTDEQVVQIQGLLAAGRSVASLAREFGVTETPIRNIKYGRRKLTGNQIGRASA